MAEKYDKLAQLLEFLEDGTLTLEEFKAAKARLVDDAGDDAEPEGASVESQAAQVVQSGTSEAPEEGMKLTGCLWGLGLAILVPFIMFALLMCSGGDDKDKGANEYNAQAQCERWVKEKLKSPSTAKFSEEVRTARGSSAWTITGQVDSQNSFGAMVRSGWSCTIELDEDTWRGNIKFTE